jgi:hypothetical protein
MTVHTFERSFDIGNRDNAAPFWEDVYRNRFINYENHVTTRQLHLDGTLTYKQYRTLEDDGVDHIITLTNGSKFRVDAKNRQISYGHYGVEDIGLEFISNDGGQYNHKNKPRRFAHGCTLGWIEKDLRTAYIAYAFIPDKLAIVLEFSTLRQAWIQHGDTWVSQYLVKPSKNEDNNRRWNTWSVYVPTDVLMQAYTEVCFVNWL